MKISAKGIALIKEFEGCELTPYYCASGVLTVGYGHTGDDVVEGVAIAQSTADALLREDLSRFEEAVWGLVQVPITQGQFDALVSFAFNAGAGSLARSSLLKALNEGKHAIAGDKLLDWCKGADDEVLEGLKRRRSAERKLWYSQQFLSAGQAK